MSPTESSQREVGGEEAQGLFLQDRVAHEFFVLGDPQDLFGAEFVPAVGAGHDLHQGDGNIFLQVVAGRRRLGGNCR